MGVNHDWRAGPRAVRRRGRALRERVLWRERKLADPMSVALTFDDGPDPVYTTATLDVLAELDVCGTFFCVAEKAAAHREVMDRMVAEGHVVGSHGLTHVDLPSLSHRELVDDLRRGRDLLAEVIERPITIYRPTHGDGMARTAATARALGMRTWLWSVDPEDWRPGISMDAIVQGCAAAGGGDVLLFHDSLEQPWEPVALDRSATVDALGPIIASVREAGLELVGLPS